MSDAADGKWYIQPKAGGQVLGPFSRHTLQYIANYGTLEPNMLVREENEGWREAAQVDFLSAAFNFRDKFTTGLDILRASARALVPPVPPDPATFGIEPGYFDRAVDGARQWEKRKHLLPEPIRWVARVVAVVAGIGVGSHCVQNSRDRGQPPLTTAWLSFLAVAILIEVAEVAHDARLKRRFYSPTFNPQPDAYKRYALNVASLRRKLNR